MISDTQWQQDMIDAVRWMLNCDKINVTEAGKLSASIVKPFPGEKSYLCFEGDEK